MTAIDATWTLDDIKREFPVDSSFQYQPNHDWVERQFKNAPKYRCEELPAGFPKSINGPSLDVQNAALKAAFNHWKSLNLPLYKLDRTTFPLPESFQTVTESWVERLLNGLGFLQLRGFNIDDYTRGCHYCLHGSDARLRRQKGIFSHVRADREFHIIH
ncbi:hypothetical protein HK100_005965 [Physocladia obscura]|uniref:Uncharacterized protein n=1 Tax=Physocladia obscura TaxID=109957 RepID=A0AAD5T881_9FUNG|nr:hypothetical protein HK100_005965 [Physocladia obscura]